MRVIVLLLLTVTLGTSNANREYSGCTIRRKFGSRFLWTRNVTTDAKSIPFVWTPRPIMDNMKSIFEIAETLRKPLPYVLGMFEISKCETDTLTCSSGIFGFVTSIQRLSDNRYAFTVELQPEVASIFQSGDAITWSDNGKFHHCIFSDYRFNDPPLCGDAGFRKADGQSNLSIFWECRIFNVYPQPECSFDYRTSVEEDFVEIIPTRNASIMTREGHTDADNYVCSLDISLEKIHLKPHQFRINFSIHFKDGDPKDITKSVNSRLTTFVLLPNVTSFKASTVTGNLKMVEPGRNVKFDCTAYGNPRPKLHLLKVSSSKRLVLEEAHPSTSWFTTVATLFMRVSCMDFGEYVCVATNDMGVVESSVISIMVQCPPEVTSLYSKHAYATVQNNAVIYIDVIAYPHELNFILKRRKPSGSSGSLRIPEYNVTVIVNQHPKCTVILDLLRLEVDHSGLYELFVHNKAGSVTYPFSVDVVDKTNSGCVVIDWNHMAVVVGAVAGIAFVIGIIIGVHVYKVITCLCGRRCASNDDQDSNRVSRRQKKEAAIHSASWTKDATLPTATPLRLNIAKARSSPVITTTPPVDDEGYLAPTPTPSPSPSPRLSKRALPELPGAERKPGSPDSQTSEATDMDGYLVVLTECDQNRHKSGSNPPSSVHPSDVKKRQSLDSQRTLDLEDKEEDDDEPPENIYHCLSPTPSGYTYVTTPGEGKGGPMKEQLFFSQDDSADKMDSLRESTPLV